MNFGFDIDQTITAAPLQFAVMMEALQADGHRCYVLTGTMDVEVTADHYVARRAQLSNCGIHEGKHYDFLEIVTAPHAENKAKHCVDNRIEFHFDDAPAHVTAIRAAGVHVAAMPHWLKENDKCQE